MQLTRSVVSRVHHGRGRAFRSGLGAIVCGLMLACAPSSDEGARGDSAGAGESIVGQVSAGVPVRMPVPPELPEGRTDTAFQMFDVATSQELFSYTPAEGDFLAWVDMWTQQTLDRDGYPNVRAGSFIQNDSLWIALSGADSATVDQYANLYVAFIGNGLAALETIDSLKAAGSWDPNGEGWRFFLPLGLPILNQASAQFFHYPPERTLEVNRNYLGDPVPYRWGQLLEFNGVPPGSTALYERILDGAPIAAPDSSGAYIPISAFWEYQLLQLNVFVQRDVAPDVTIPMVAYGVPAMATLEKTYFVNLDVLVPQNAHMRLFDPARTPTPVLGANHPYHFYATAQVYPPGNGQLGPGCQMAADLMRQDVIAACWQAKMAANPTADPHETLQSCADEWYGQSRAGDFCTLVQHQGSLIIPEFHPGESCPNGDYCFAVTVDSARATCGRVQNDPCYQFVTAARSNSLVRDR